MSGRRASRTAVLLRDGAIVLAQHAGVPLWLGQSTGADRERYARFLKRGGGTLQDALFRWA